MKYDKILIIESCWYVNVHYKSLSTFLYMLEYFQNKMLGIPGVKGERNGKLLPNGHTVSIWYDEYYLKIDSGDGFITLEYT